MNSPLRKAGWAALLLLPCLALPSQAHPGHAGHDLWSTLPHFLHGSDQVLIFLAVAALAAGLAALARRP